MKPSVLTGADQLEAVGRSVLSGKKIGLLTNPTGINSRFESTIDICAGLGFTRLTALFACEHGIRGDRQAGVPFDDETDPDLGIPVFSLYGKNKRPQEYMLEHVDAVLFDIQDLGVRFYTYLTTLIYMMRACAEFGKELIVLDRPNPLGGRKVEGGLLRPGFESMVGAWQMPYQTGLTIGEFAVLANKEAGIGCKLHVIPLQRWKRGMEYAETGLPWLPPSPNLPTVDTARVYAGTCLFEGTNLSEGRGTTRPFELIGAPWLKAKPLCSALNALHLPGIRFHPVTFTPMFSKHKGELCHGVFCAVTDKSSFRSVITGLHMLHHIAVMHEERFEWLTRPDGKPFIDLLTGSDRVRLSIHDPSGLRRILEDYGRDEEKWRRLREPYLLYRED